jgi:hypothetical protein
MASVERCAYHWAACYNIGMKRYAEEAVIAGIILITLSMIAALQGCASTPTSQTAACPVTSTKIGGTRKCTLKDKACHTIPAKK